MAGNQSKYWRSLTLGLFLAITLAGSTPAWATGGIHWYDYEEGTALMQSEGKKGFLTFYADWCRYCKLMENETFQNSAVVAYLNRNFVAMKINSEEDRKRTREYSVIRLPISWFLSPNGERISNREGYLPPEDMLNLLKYVNTDSYEKMSLLEFLSRQN
jgi:thioredoxin-related protein